LERLIKVLIIDDSAVMRELLKSILSADSRFEVVGTSPDAVLAKNKIPRVKPDVLTLDVEMPGMDGLTFLQQLMDVRPMPVVMVSSLTAKGAKETFRALELGAVDFIPKPKLDNSDALDMFSSQLCEKIAIAAQASIYFRISHAETGARNEKSDVASHVSQYEPGPITIKSDPDVTRKKLVVVGASTGGTQAIQKLAEDLPANSPPIAVVQHMPPHFTEMYAKRINQVSALDIREAVDGDLLTPGTMLIANGAYHMTVKRNASREFSVNVFDGELVNQHKPSVDVLFDSASLFSGDDVLGIILTGMGKDGARGMLAMHQKGSYTIAQDKSSCVIYGMPDQANKLGGVSKILHLDDIPGYIERWVDGGLTRSKVAS